jgi:hypothetical protein
VKPSKPVNGAARLVTVVGAENVLEAAGSV